MQVSSFIMQNRVLRPDKTGGILPPESPFFLFLPRSRPKVPYRPPHRRRLRFTVPRSLPRERKSGYDKEGNSRNDPPALGEVAGSFCNGGTCGTRGSSCPAISPEGGERGPISCERRKETVNSPSAVFRDCGRRRETKTTPREAPPRRTATRRERASTRSTAR